MIQYLVANMRVIKPSKRVAESNPDRFVTVKGQFADAEGNKLSIASKDITLDMARDPETVIDVAKGILILPSNPRGRKAAESLSVDELNSQLAELRKS